MISNYTIASVELENVKEWFLKKHYAKRIPSISYCFALLKENKIVGVCSFGRPMAHILIKNAFGGDYQENFLELNRLVTNDGLQRNTTSFFVSKCLKMLPKPSVVVSYADTSQKHNGYIYQATNFIYTGLSVKFQDYAVKGLEHLHGASVLDLVGRSDINGHIDKVKLLKEKFGEENVYMKERPQKHRYFFFLGNKKQIKDMKKKFIYKTEPYPKGKNENYDASHQPYSQVSLF